MIKAMIETFEFETMVFEIWLGNFFINSFLIKER